MDDEVHPDLFVLLVHVSDGVGAGHRHLSDLEVFPQRVKVVGALQSQVRVGEEQLDVLVRTVFEIELPVPFPSEDHTEHMGGEALDADDLHHGLHTRFTGSRRRGRSCHRFTL